MISWANPEWFMVFWALPLALIVYLWRFYKKRTPTITFSNLKHFESIKGNYRVLLLGLSPLFLLAGLALVIVSMARPQLENTIVERKAEGIDIMLVLDISTSMKAEDLKPNRFDAAKIVAKDFIDKRISDRIGLAIFAKKSFTVVPPTLDYDLVKKLIDEIEMGVVEDGTAIGMGLATGVNRLKDSKAESKVVILLTDGQNNAGEVDPVTAADLAASYEIKIYTIGAGTKGMAPYPMVDAVFGKRYQNIAVDIDETMLREIARKTGGEYFRATDSKSLAQIYAQIDTLERTEVDELIYTDYKDLYHQYLFPGLILITLGFILDRSVIRLELA
jgi:Ca-activated chloride channel family protein